ncbi:variant erythrocyte surface antigen-1 family protein [Babesia caballi]|uniref:Variant erythrocyte surface antigen-1 family protein n=1 Tax=Babesia caballi TaxID=5871 RepID=A0AAV4LZK4_BABCB|nr:variant erythrocyte surface antigen-1 family protein [Babesia caballi]
MLPLDSPSFTPVNLSFGCPSNLKEAIDWILRVTGKDGRGGDGTSDLTAQVKQLLEQVEESGNEFNGQIGKVTQALGTDGFITKLAEGLQQFIGYDGGTITYATSGIGMSNDPLERIKDGILVFVYGMVKNLEKYVQNAQAAMKTLTDNKANFANAVQNELNLSQTSGSEFKDVLEAVKKVNDFNGKTDFSALTNTFKTYLGNVLKQVMEDKNVKQAQMSTANDVQKLVMELKNNFEKVVVQLTRHNPKQPIDFGQGDLKKHIDKIYNGSDGIFKRIREGLPKFESRQPKAKALVNAAYHAASYSLNLLQRGYKSYYQGAEWSPSDSNGEHKKCAKIFLACLPLIFGNLGRLYWKCRQDKAHGGWKDMQLDGKGKGTDEGKDLKNFMDLMSLSTNWLNGGKKGGDVERVMTSAFAEFSAAASSGQFYTDFLNKFRDNCITTWQSSSNVNDNFLSGLYLCSTSYLRHQHQKKAATARPPSSIREMLYWLMGLTATPQFGDLLGHIHNVVGTNFHVAVSGSSKTGETLSVDQVTSYILSTCYTSPSVLDIIQGSLEFNASKGEPWLHDLYSNTEFPFKYPSSGSALLYALSDYTYALQFQLSFLYKQCQDMYINTCGWQFCTFGRDVNSTLNDKVVKSHICSVGCSKHGNSDNYKVHSNGDCKHEGCGQTDKPSPLQAFLTDNLKGFSRGHPSDPSSHLSDCSGGSTCHVPMGFANHLRPGNSLQGGHISLTLKSFCGSSNTPLCQLGETLTCLSKHTPRTLGDLFGFIWHLNDQLFKNTKPSIEQFAAKLYKPFESSGGVHNIPQFLLGILKTLSNSQSGSPTATVLSRSLETMASAIPFLYQLFTVSKLEFLPDAMFAIKNIAHTSKQPAYSGQHNDLYGLYDQICNSQTCGKYLFPLTHSEGATYASNFASTYLSWVLYLCDNLQTEFQQMLYDLNTVTCTSNSEGHKPSGSCDCRSVVQCGGVLPLLYQNGFRFYDAFRLKNGTDKQGNNKRTCQHFTQQLEKVLSAEAPLEKLTTTIDSFLYAIRWEFFSKLSGFWTIYTCLILYTFFFLLDTLHLRSHLKLTASQTIPPLALLTSGNPLPITKLTYIGK